MKLSKRRIVLTGGTSGIGRELALLLAVDNAVIVLARETPRSARVQAEVPDIVVVHVDLSDPEAVQAVGRQLAGGTPPDGLINCAALQNTPWIAAPDFDLASIRREIDINLTAVCLLSALLLPALLSRETAFIMNINSGLGLVILFTFFPDAGGMMLITAFWGVWHLVSGLTLSQLWARQSRRAERHEQQQDAARRGAQSRPAGMDIVDQHDMASGRARLGMRRQCEGARNDALTLAPPLAAE